jgi:hypothetical protein
MATPDVPVPPPFRRRLLLIVALLAVLLAAASGGIDRALDALVTPLSPAQTRVVLKRTEVGAATAFVAVRALGRAVAVLASTTVNAEVGAVVHGGASLEIGNVLRPFEQLLDAFGDVLMVSLVSVTIQLVLVDVLDAFALRWVLPAGLALLALAVATRTTPGGALRRLAQALIAGAVVAKLLLPVSIQASEYLSDRFLRDRADQAAQTLDATKADLTAATLRPAEAPDRAWYDPRRLTEGLASLSPDRLSDSFDRITASVERAVEASLTAMAVFVLQTVIFPLAMMALVVWLARTAVRRWRMRGA